MASLPRLVALALPLAVLAAPTAHAVELAEGVKAGVHLRSRFVRHDGGDGNAANNAPEYFENRARLTLDVAPLAELRALFQLQDVRVWGEESDTLFDYAANGLDVHQAFMDIRLQEGKLLLRVGRQEIAWDEQRLIGAVGWTPHARSFDAIRLSYQAPAHVALDAFFSMVLDNETAAPAGAISSLSDNPHRGSPQRGEVAGLHATWTFLEGDGRRADLTVLGVLDHAADVDGDRATADDRMRATLGLRHAGKFGVLDYRLEGYLQTGGLGNGSIQAYLAAAKVGVVLPELRNLSVTLWGDYLSGDSDPSDDTVEVFDTLYATNHAFYGFADFFLNVPAHTGGKGLIDVALKAGIDLLEGWKLGVNAHRFLAANPRGGRIPFGWEVDVTTKVQPFEQLTVFAGLFAFLPEANGGALPSSRVGRTDPDPDLGFVASLQLDL